jgi:hypothetical protein
MFSDLLSICDEIAIEIFSKHVPAKNMRQSQKYLP